MLAGRCTWRSFFSRKSLLASPSAQNFPLRGPRAGGSAPLHPPIRDPFRDVPPRRGRRGCRPPVSEAYSLGAAALRKQGSTGRSTFLAPIRPLGVFLSRARARSKRHTMDTHICISQCQASAAAASGSSITHEKSSSPPYSSARSAVPTSSPSSS